MRFDISVTFSVLHSSFGIQIISLSWAKLKTIDSLVKIQNKLVALPVDTELEATSLCNIREGQLKLFLDFFPTLKFTTKVKYRYSD